MGQENAISIFDHIEFFARLGCLHDVEVSKIEVDASEAKVSIKTTDLLANFAELEGYKSELPCTLLFSSVTEVSVFITPKFGIRIDEATVVAGPSCSTLKLLLNEGNARASNLSDPIRIEFGGLHMLCSDAELKYYNDWLLST